MGISNGKYKVIDCWDHEAENPGSGTKEYELYLESDDQETCQMLLDTYFKNIGHGPRWLEDMVEQLPNGVEFQNACELQVSVWKTDIRQGHITSLDGVEVRVGPLVGTDDNQEVYDLAIVDDFTAEDIEKLLGARLLEIEKL